ncbi:MAG: hypothetical protein H8D97_00495 [Proteobacteria bacterium]|nr:hypothetical protein [Pseudomonadota bacterium]
MDNLRTTHIEFNANNFETVMQRINNIKEKIQKIRDTEFKLQRESKALRIELMGTEELIERTKRQNPEHFLLIPCEKCNHTGQVNIYKDQPADVLGYCPEKCYNCMGSGKVLNTEFIKKNKFIQGIGISASEIPIYGYILDNNGKKVHVYNIKSKETLCKTKNHNFQIVEESQDQCSVCRREFAKLTMP